mmetsp:Transcript_91856/g.230842  ORF Transcript_91856/g.230842 Transcript_91856/m.230842 type:complete len:296 (+) Transcript_91856:161-1048(+)
MEARGAGFSAGSATELGEAWRQGDDAAFGAAGEVKRFGARVSMLRLFPVLFTLCCSMLFLVPMCLVLTIGSSKELAYFWTPWHYVVAVIPLFILAAHYIHMRSGVPNKTAVVTALVVPSLLLLVCANGQYLQATVMVERLASSDCEALQSKQELQKAWQAAYDLYMGCLKETSAAYGFDVAVLQQNFRVQDCEEYPQAAGLVGSSSSKSPYAEDWKYLRYLEENSFCSGWCQSGIQLWSNGASKDSCSIAVATVFDLYAQPHAGEVVAVMVITLIVSAMFLILVGPLLRKNGIEW